MLKLVVNNTTNQENTGEKLTCRNSCEYYDEITESCSIKSNVNVDSTYEVLGCTHFLSKIVPDENYERPKPKALNNMDDDSMLKEVLEQKAILDASKYPMKPDFPSRRSDATWFVAPCGTYGCWIISGSANKFSIVKDVDEVEKGWHANVYRSPIPLHDHKSSLGLASRIAWVVDEEGYGQYALIFNGDITKTRYPRPRNWKRSY
ncbi:hypothetical protein WKH57_24900 [Niallia taxi]|uniref:hypothetical protein n=1 Tax=Niallia taxi TaxID=2499688 RepID=UPI00203E2A71|nr:hypothetical protein [Niallia taxi]MCM3216805.1 hypothetical protein [Niallia taxi]